MLDVPPGCIIEMEPIEERMYMSKASHLDVPKHQRPPIWTEEAVHMVSFSFSSGLNQISKVKLNDYNKALSGRQPTIRFVLNLIFFSFIIDSLFSNDFMF